MIGVCATYVLCASYCGECYRVKLNHRPPSKFPDVSSSPLGNDTCDNRAMNGGAQARAQWAVHKNYSHVRWESSYHGYLIPCLRVTHYCDKVGSLSSAPMSQETYDGSQVATSPASTGKPC